MKLWLARHAAPLIDSGICYGSLDVEADEAATQSSARALAAALGRGGTNVVVRLSAFILLCIGIQILWNGVKELAHLA